MNIKHIQPDYEEMPGKKGISVLLTKR